MFKSTSAKIYVVHFGFYYKAGPSIMSGYLAPRTLRMTRQNTSSLCNSMVFFTFYKKKIKNISLPRQIKYFFSSLLIIIFFFVTLIYTILTSDSWANIIVNFCRCLCTRRRHNFFLKIVRFN